MYHNMKELLSFFVVIYHTCISNTSIGHSYVAWHLCSCPQPCHPWSNGYGHDIIKVVGSGVNSYAYSILDGNCEDVCA